MQFRFLVFVLATGVAVSSKDPNAERSLRGNGKKDISDAVKKTKGKNKHVRCFHERSMVDVRLSNGDSKRLEISQLRAGMEVRTLNWRTGKAHFSSVNYTQARPCPASGMQEFVRVANLYVSPSHPVFVNGSWTLPQKLSPASLHPCKYTYTMVLEELHDAVLVDDVPATPFDDEVLGDRDTTRVEEAAKKLVQELEDVKQRNGLRTNDIVRMVIDIAQTV